MYEVNQHLARVVDNSLSQSLVGDIYDTSTSTMYTIVPSPFEHLQTSVVINNGSTTSLGNSQACTMPHALTFQTAIPKITTRIFI